MIQQHVESSGRSLSPEEISLIRQTVTTFSNLSLTELARTLCELLEWKRPNGKLKHEECRALLEHLQADGLIALPGLRNTAAPGKRKVVLKPETNQTVSITGIAGQFEEVTLPAIASVASASLGMDSGMLSTVPGSCPAFRARPKNRTTSN